MVAVLVAVASGGYLLTGALSERSPKEVQESRLDSIVASPPISLRLPAGQAGLVEHDSGARIDVPQGATQERATVSIAQVSPPLSPLDVRRAFDFSVDGSRLAGPVTVHIPFDLEPGQDASSVRALRWDEEAGAWDPVPGLVDESARTIAVTTDRLRLFSALPVEVEASCAASPGEVAAGETLRVASTGTSFTLGAIGIYMAPAVTRAGDGVVVAGEPSIRAEVTPVGWGDSFELTYETALTEPGEYRVFCRVFWASGGTGETLANPSATVRVGRVYPRHVGADVRLEQTNEQQRPVDLGKKNGLLVEVRSGDDEQNRRFGPFGDCASADDGRAPRRHDIGPGDRYGRCARVLAPGESERLYATVTTRWGRDGGYRGLEWSSSAPEIATVSRDGVVTGVAPGEAVISVRAGSAGAWIEVKVATPPDAGQPQSGRRWSPAAGSTTAATGRQPGAGFTEDFSGNLDTDRWLLYGSADNVQLKESVQLTAARRNQLGFLMLRQPVRLHGSSIEFSFEIGGGTGADGLGLLLLQSLPDFSRFDPSEHAGGGWGSRYLEGYVVAFDTHPNRAGRWSRGGRDFYHRIADPSGNFVALVELGAGGDVFAMDHLATKNLSVDLRNSGPFGAEVAIGVDGNVKVYLSNEGRGMGRTLVVDHTIEDFDTSYAYFGFIGATGASTDRHVIRSVKYKPHRPEW